MTFIDFCAKYIYRPNFKEVGYGDSSYGILVVTNDPYVFSGPRIIIYITIGVGIIVSVAHLLSALRTSNFDAQHGGDNKRQWLTLLSCLSIVFSGVHHIDNFLRIDQYFLPAGIYNGFFFILDVGLANWVIATLFLTFGVKHILLNSSHYFVKYNTSTLFDRHHVALYWVYIHCVMIWSGQLHYSVESFNNFSAVSNMSILLEGWGAIVLNIYVVYLHWFVFPGCEDCVNITLEGEENDERAQLVSDEEERGRDEVFAKGGEVEMKHQMIRRRSK